MGLIDLHCDTISRLYQTPEDTLSHNHLCIDIDGMIRAKTQVQFFACFVNAAAFENSRERRESGRFSKETWDKSFHAVIEMSERTDQEQSSKMKVVNSYSEIRENIENGVISAVKTVEEGGIIDGSISRLDALYNQGIRLITLTWNHENCLGFPNSHKPDIMEKGLTGFGMRIIEAMNEKGMIVDVSHLSDGGFWDCIRKSRAPICASHSNARSLCEHPRNLTDEMLKALGESGGVAGLNFYPPFLKKEGQAVVDDIAKHAVYMIEKGGEELPAIGTDFDGFDNQSRPQWVGNVREIGLVWEAMKKRGITERQLDKIMSGNAMRLLGEVL